MFIHQKLLSSSCEEHSIESHGRDRSIWRRLRVVVNAREDFVPTSSEVCKRITRDWEKVFSLKTPIEGVCKEVNGTIVTAGKWRRLLSRWRRSYNDTRRGCSWSRRLTFLTFRLRSISSIGIEVNVSCCIWIPVSSIESIDVISLMIRDWGMNDVNEVCVILFQKSIFISLEVSGCGIQSRDSTHFPSFSIISSHCRCH